MTELGIAKERMTYVGKGVTKLAAKDDPSKNRRVTVSIK